MTRNGVEYVECKRADCPFFHLVVNGRTYAEWRHPAPVEPREVYDRELDELREGYAATYLSPFVRNAQAGRLPAKEYGR